MRADYINPVLYSVMETLNRITHHKPHPGRIKLKKHELAQGAVTGLVNMQINNHVGSLALSFSRDLILHIASELSHHQVRHIDNTVLNVAGRLTYLVCSEARQYMQDKEAHFMLTAPQVFQGFRQRIHHASHDPKLMMQFETPAGICFSEFSIAGLGEIQQGVRLQ
ncbi:chemotaxis protein CheX [Oceanospirillum sanctuarii]|uniref:chemotaxis protein CheX n=1 Tax=Oceanospirillum sanctuarii TaxID=1434821 RepID=UPI000A39D5F2|nr:chemotaxis protein CheX [Oceanospirillum sanctuarii]